MTEIMWLMNWQEELQLAASLATPLLLLFLTIGVFSVARQLKLAARARRPSPVQKPAADKPLADTPETKRPAAVQTPRADEADSRLIAGVLQEIFP